jgi:hypothetical protein
VGDWALAASGRSMVSRASGRILVMLRIIDFLSFVLRLAENLSP